MEATHLLNNNMMQFSMYENLKTGNLIFDMILSTLAVSFITSMGVFLKDYFHNNTFYDYYNCLYRNKNEILLEGYYVVKSWNGNFKTEFPIVIDALFWYISKPQFSNQMKTIKLHSPNFNNLVQKTDNCDEEYDSKYKNDNEILLKKNLIFRPQSSAKFTIDDINIELYEVKIDNEKSTRENLLFNLNIYLKHKTKSTVYIKEWLENIQYEYEKFQKTVLDKQKKVFTMIKQEEQIEWYEEDFISGKTWDNLYCTNKDLIKTKLDFFINNRDWYKKRGIPWTFGVLTYGPPGCGKTSLEKVFLNYLDRHGVQLNIDETTTYKDIREIFYNPYINGKYVPLKNRIYIIPDIDAMGKVLLKRTESNDNLNKKLTFDLKKNTKHSIENFDSEESQENNNNIEKLELENTILANETKILQEKLKQQLQKNDNTNELLLSSSESIQTPGSKTSLVDTNFMELMKKKSQGVSLSQILNLLDGIVELDGRVLIACTNHIEKLDPALIRPGRIDCVIELGLCTHKMIKDILENFYEKKVSQREINKIKENYYTPCKVYEICFRNTECIKKALLILQDENTSQD